MVEVGKIGDKTLVLDGRYISIFRAGKLVWKRAYRGYILPDGNLYSYRRRVRITELSGNTLTDYQIKIEIGAGDPIFAHARSAGEDIRFCYYPEENMIPYWIEKFDPVAEEAIIWVKVSEIPANSEIEIYMYYGNPTVASASDGNATFEFFDDFEDGTLNKWEEVHTWGAPESSIESADPISGSYSVKLAADDGEGIFLGCKNLSIENAVIHATAKMVAAPDFGGLGLFGRSQGGDRGVYGTTEKRDVVIEIYSDEQGKYLASTSFTTNLDTLYEVYLAWFNDKIEFGIREVGGDWTKVSATTLRTGEGAWGILAIEATDIFDNVRVRKYTEPEPSVSVGEEE